MEFPAESYVEVQQNANFAKSTVENSSGETLSDTVTLSKSYVHTDERTICIDTK